MFPWNNIPSGGDEQMKLVLRVFLYGVLGIGAVVGLFYLWSFLQDLLGENDQRFSWSISWDPSNMVEGTLSFTERLLMSWIPILLLLGVLVVLAIIGVNLFFKTHYRRQAENGVRYIRILPSNSIQLDLDKISELTRTFGGMVRPLRERIRYGRPWFRLRFAIPPGSNEIGIYMAYPVDKENSVKDTLASVYPSAEIHDISPEQFPWPEKGGAGGHFIFQIGQRKGLPLASIHQKKQSQLGSILNCLRPGTYLDIQFAPVSWKELEERSEDVLDSLKNKKMKDLDPEEKARRVSLMQRLTGRELTFHVRISLWSNHERATSVIRSTAESIETAMKYDGSIRFIRHDWWNPLNDRNLVPIPYPFTIMTWTCDEIANLFHIPPSNHYIYQEPPDVGPDSRGYLVHLEDNQRSLSPDELREGVLIGKIRHPLEEREVRVDYEQLSKHFLLTGANGMGKTSLTIEMVQSMLNEWLENPDTAPGFTIIDPAREVIPIIENRLRVAEKFQVKVPKEKIHHFNLSHDTTHIPALNLLHEIEGLSTNQLAELVATILVTQPESQESLMQTKRLMAMAVQSLLEDNEPHTILGIDDLFRNESFRLKVLQNVKDPYVKRFWSKASMEDWINNREFVLQRIDRLLQSPIMRRLLCQKNMSLDIQKYMDEGHIVLIDTYGLRGYDMRVIAGLLVNQYYQTAKKRMVGSKFHLMLIDEAHMAQIPLLTDIFYEDRKYSFGLGLITREIDSFNNQELMQAMKANIGMILSCGQTEGGDEVEDLTRGYVKASFLEKLPVCHAAVCIRSKRNRRSDVTTCVVENEPPFVYREDGKVADHRSNEKDIAMQWGLEWGLELMKNSPYVRPIEEVDQEISEYMMETLMDEKKTS